MQKQEFTKLLEEKSPSYRTFTDKEYSVIEMVYMYHPAISDTNGKQAIADLYFLFGIEAIHDMLPRSERIKKIEDAIMEKKGDLLNLEQEMMKAKTGA